MPKYLMNFLQHVCIKEQHALTSSRKTMNCRVYATKLSGFVVVKINFKIELSNALMPFIVQPAHKVGTTKVSELFSDHANYRIN